MTQTSKNTEEGIQLEGNIKFSKKIPWKDFMYVFLLLANFGKGYIIPTPTMEDVREIQVMNVTQNSDIASIKTGMYEINNKVNRVEARQLGISPKDVDEFNEYMKLKHGN